MYFNSDIRPVDCNITSNKYMYFNSDIQPVDCNINSTSTCISIRTFDWSTAILIQTPYHYKVTCSSASLCIAMPCCCLFSPALMLFSWLTTSERSFSSTLSVLLLRPAIQVAWPQSMSSSSMKTSWSLSVSCSISTRY